MASVRHRPGRPLPYDAMWRDPETGKQRAKSFRMKREAVAYGARMEAAKAEGRYVDPAGGQVTFRTYAESWRSSQVHRAGTADQIRMNFETPRLSPPRAPAAGRHPPERGPGPREGLTSDAVPSHGGSDAQLGVERVQGRRGRPAHPTTLALHRCQAARRWSGARSSRPTSPRWRRWFGPSTLATVPWSCSGPAVGLVSAEALGLTVDRVDFLRRTVRIDRQLTRAPGPAPGVRAGEGPQEPASHHPCRPGAARRAGRPHGRLRHRAGGPVVHQRAGRQGRATPPGATRGGPPPARSASSSGDGFHALRALLHFDADCWRCLVQGSPGAPGPRRPRP